MGNEDDKGLSEISQSFNTVSVQDNYTKRSTDRRGYFIVVDGLDGIGKGEIIRTLIGYEQRLGRNTFDAVSFSRAEEKGLPELSDFWDPPRRHYHTIITAEPTYVGIGHVIRNEIISKNKRTYTAEDETNAYSLDRLVQMKKVVAPAIINGIRTLQSRCVASTLTYQSLRAQDEGRNPEDERKKILEHAGSRFQLEWAPDLLIIPTIENVQELMKRIGNRKEGEKYDNAIFENLKFQERLKPLYESSWLKEIFESKGTRVEYLDAGRNLEDSKKQTIDIYKKFLEDKEGTHNL